MPIHFLSSASSARLRKSRDTVTIYNKERWKNLSGESSVSRESRKKENEENKNQSRSTLVFLQNRSFCLFCCVFIQRCLLDNIREWHYIMFWLNNSNMGFKYWSAIPKGSNWVSECVCVSVKCALSHSLLRSWINFTLLAVSLFVHVWSKCTSSWAWIQIPKEKSINSTVRFRLAYIFEQPQFNFVKITNLF